MDNVTYTKLKWLVNVLFNAVLFVMTEQFHEIESRENERTERPCEAVSDTRATFLQSRCASRGLFR